jgi:HEAT repeat protein
MNASKFAIVTLAAALMLLASARSAHADRGVVLGDKDLAPKQRSALVAAIQKSRAQHPEAFRRVAAVAGMVAKLDKEKRGRFATISRPLFAVGKHGLMPMLEMLAVSGPQRGKLTDSAWTTLRVGLVEAVGKHRDPVAVPVLDAILDKDSDLGVLRAAAEALGRIGDDASAQKLATLATHAGPKQQAVLAGMGDCRRPVAVHALADFSRKSADQATTLLTLRALGRMGNAWAWKTPVLQKTGEETDVRQTAAQALVSAYARYQDPALRLRAQKSIIMVDDASTPSLIEAEKNGASAETKAALDRLAQKFAHSPLHKYE